MAMNVAGYYNAPVAGAAPQYPAPVVVPVNNAGANNTDAYIAQAVSVAPLGAGMMPGKTATNAVREAKGWFLKSKGRAATSRGMSAKAAAASNGRGALLGSITGAIKSSLIFNGLMSLAVNGYKVYKKQETMADGGANFAGDMTSALVGGAAGGLAAGAGTFLLAGILGTGLPLTLAGMALGCVGYFIADNLLKNTSFYNKIKTTVHGWLA